VTSRDFDRLLADVPGFGQCQSCGYAQAGSPALCYRCASRTMEALAPLGERCAVCDLPYSAGESSCGNPVCRMEPDDRWFEWNYAIAMRSGALETAISRYKYGGRRGWAAIFGRILVGFLDAHAALFAEIGLDLIVASPAYTGPGAKRAWDHIREVMVAADREQGAPPRWQFDLAEPPIIVKTGPTEPMVGKSAADRRANAQTALRDALSVTDRTRTRDLTVAVLDDVFTGGWTLREVARALRRDGGATAVYGVTLSRQPYGRRLAVDV